MPGGRPTKYCPIETLAKTREYIRDYKTLGNEEVIPTIAGLAFHLKISRETIYAWAKEGEQVPSEDEQPSSDRIDKSDFSDIVGELMAKQELILMNGGLKGVLNPTITKLALTKHNYTDKAEVGGIGGGAIKMTHVTEYE